eukprot:859258_1
MANKVNNETIISIDNTKPNFDIYGNIIDAHEGVIKRWDPNGLYYYYAISYELCNESLIVCNQTGTCAHTYDHNISLWSSPNLTSGSWKFEKFLFDTTTPGRPVGVYFRPYIFYNKFTNKYVLWIKNSGNNLTVYSNRN